MSEDNPFLAPQTTSKPAGGAAVNSAVEQSMMWKAWQEPLRSQILDVATHQRWLNLHLLIAITGGILFAFLGQRANPRPDQSPMTIVGLLIMVVLLPNYVAILVRIYLMVKGFKSKDSPIAAVLAMFLPLIGLILLLYYSGKATKFLNRYGIKVGLLGASPRQVARQLDSAEQAANPAPAPAPVPPNARSSAASALPMAQAIPAAPARPAPPAAPAPKPGTLPMAKPLAAPAAKPAAALTAKPAAGQLPVARPLPPQQPKPPKLS